MQAWLFSRIGNPDPLPFLLAHEAAEYFAALRAKAAAQLPHTAPEIDEDGSLVEADWCGHDGVAATRLP